MREGTAICRKKGLREVARGLDAADYTGTDRDALLTELERLYCENRDLKALCTRLSEAEGMLARREASWLFALEGNRDGVWDWNAVTNEVYFSPRWKEMLGYQDNEISNHLSEWDTRVHPDDRDAVYADLNRHLSGQAEYYLNEHRVRCKDGSWLWILDRGKVVSWTEDGRPLRIVGTHTDIHARKTAELERIRLLAELTDANKRVRQLSGLLPICASCKRIRDEHGNWNQLESYIRSHSDADFTHSICPECAKRLYP